MFYGIMATSRIFLLEKTPEQATPRKVTTRSWVFRVGTPIGICGPSLGNGMLYVPIGSHEMPALKLGAIIAFGLPDGVMQNSNSSRELPKQ